MYDQTPQERIAAKAGQLEVVVDNAKDAGLVSTNSNTSAFFSQFDDRDPPPFSNFSNAPPTWGKA
jgi:hypothetical protein